MRISLWPALVCGSMLVATVGNTVFAAPPAAKPSRAVTQADADDELDDLEDSSDATEGIGGFNPYQPMQYVQGGAAPPDGAGPAPGDGGGPGPMGFDPGMTAPNAWPGESPYTQYPRQETFNSGGLWQYNASDDTSVQRFFTTEYLFGQGLKPGNHYIGSIQNHALDWFPGTYGGPFNTQTTELFGNFMHNGTKASTGFWNADGSGMTISGFILFESSLDNDLVSPHAIAGQPATLKPMWGIIVDEPNGNGTILPFDTRFFQKFQQNIYGADADFYVAPFFERETFKLKLVFGAKYLQIHEDFYVQGDNSGLDYVTTAGGTAAGPPFTQLGIPPYSTVFQSSATSNLVGPALGVRYDLGGDTFKIWGQTKIAAAYNHESLTVAGNNVGSYVVSTGLSGVANLTQGPNYSGTLLPLLTNQTALAPTSTRQQVTNGHISPIIDTCINVDFPGFAWIPYVNKFAVFKTANMRVGFNYVYVGDVARPANIINYNILTPTINSTHTWFEYSSVNFAVNWKF